MCAISKQSPAAADGRALLTRTQRGQSGSAATRVQRGASRASLSHAPSFKRRMKQPANALRRLKPMNDSKILLGKRVVVFGAGGSIGAAVAKECAAEGAEVFVS